MVECPRFSLVFERGASDGGRKLGAPCITTRYAPAVAHKIFRRFNG